MSYSRQADWRLVADALGATATEPLRLAALRVFRQNCAPKPTLDIARIVLELGPDASAREQWDVIHRAARQWRKSRGN